MIKEVEFLSEGAMLRGLLFLPESQTKRPPLVIMTHGTSATMYMVTDKYAESFYRAGLAVLLYDHRNFGRSEGEPRQEINPWIQCRVQNHGTFSGICLRSARLFAFGSE